MLSDHDIKTLHGCETITMTVSVENCYYQVDFFTGDLVTGEELNNGTKSYGDRKIKWANGGTQKCNTETDYSTKLTVKKSKLFENIAVGDKKKFQITVRNIGNKEAKNVRVCDSFGSEWLFVKAIPASNAEVTEGKVCWVIPQLDKNSSTSVKVQLQLVGKIISSSSSTGHDQYTVNKYEQQVDLEPGQTRTTQLACADGAIVTDGEARIDHVDQGTGTYSDVHVLRSWSINDSTYEFTLENTATGRAQTKVFVTCINRTKDLVIVGKASGQTNAPGQTTMACPAGSTPIAPSYNVESGRPWSSDAGYGANNEWVMGFSKEGSASTQVSCLDLKAISLKEIGKDISLNPGAAFYEITCPVDYKGIVATYHLPGGSYLGGHDPRPITRAFWLINETSSPLAARIGLVCMSNRVGKTIVKYDNSASNKALATASNAKLVEDTIELKVSN